MNIMGTVAEEKEAAGLRGKYFDNKRSRPATEAEIAELDGAAFVEDGNVVQTLGSEDTFVIELPKKIFCQHTSLKQQVRTIINLENIEADTLRDLVAEQVKITVSMCTGYFALQGMSDFVVDATAEGLKGETEERGGRFSELKFLDLKKKLKADTATAEEREYLDKHQNTYREMKAKREAIEAELGM
jgi:hypothetical protein